MSEIIISGWTVLDAAHQALRTAVRGVPADGWTLPTPCADWTATQVLQHAAGDQLAYAAAITGGPGPGYDPFKPSGVLDRTPHEVTEEALNTTASAWATVAKDAPEVTTPIPPHSMSGELGAGAAGLDAAVHAWDIAVAAGLPSPLTPELARPLLKVAMELVEPLRQYGVFGPALPAGPDDAVAALLSYLGRDPHWKP
ncbi:MULTISPECIES: TIGR03086 family metal-binding protein [Thermomonosporaceae]|uniref:TIGR03086 family metal-binding protein n=1 Tax=Thermomonosporaceae TaxID=2012 RepID=UPI00255AB790|nr:MULTISPECIES: TIGR03086 family metal-binding protein [Thermomonosporaceae]MDL4774463.1 TIGR03086 family metal-binding protein [Actinomadura xylanilytica]